MIDSTKAGSAPGGVGIDLAFVCATGLAADFGIPGEFGRPRLHAAILE